MFRPGRIGVGKLATVACAAGLLLQCVACRPVESGGRSDTTRTGAIRTDTARRAATAGAPPATPPAPVGVRATSAAPAVRISVAQSGTHGPYLVDAKGRALYLLEEDGADRITCIEMCAVVWPPLLAGQATPVAGDSVVQSRLLGSVPRPGGGAQVSYGGRPLYYYVGDAKPGDVRGQHVEDSWGEWYLVSAAGRPIEGERGGRGERRSGAPASRDRGRRRADQG